MPTIFSHPAAAIALFPWFRAQIGRPGVLLAGAALTMAPDLDVAAFSFGIPYEHMFGHRGISHSLLAALLMSGLLAGTGARVWRLHFGLLWVYFFLCMVSHGLADMLTSGGLGIALLAPFSNERYFFDIRPIRVSSFGLTDFMSGRWTTVIASELRWIWLPALGLAVAGLGVGRIVARLRAQPAPSEAE
jgi:inner membrane protein